MIKWTTYGGVVPLEDDEFGFMVGGEVVLSYGINEDNVAAVERLAKQLRETLNAGNLR